MRNSIFEPLVNSIYEVGEVGLKALYKLLNIKQYFDIEEYFKIVQLKNKREEYPKLINIHESNKGYIYLVSCPRGLSIEDFKKLEKGLEIQLRHRVDIRVRDGYIELEVITVELQNIIDYKVPSKCKDSIYIPFADSLEGTVSLDLKETPHTLCTGTTGGGKSITTRNIITSVLNLYSNDVNLHLIDFKIVELSIFKNIKQCKCYVNEIEEAKEVIADLLEECKRRYKLFDEVGVTNIYDYNKKVSSDKKLKFDFIVIEEFVMLLQDKKKIAMSTLKTLASLSRASGQFLYITAQRFDNTVIDLVLRSVIGNRICHKVESENDSKLIIDEVGANKLRGNGHILFKNGSKVTECQSYYITDEQVKEYTRKHLKKVSDDKYSKYKQLNDTKVIEQKEQVKIVDFKEVKEADSNLLDLSFLDNI